ncbi:MAG: formylglycine-generating enzyme family protein [Armatimonadota bacterium]|nr:formylglycine-generating enzyme family protein [Armatimonadota bacterium]
MKVGSIQSFVALVVLTGFGWTASSQCCLAAAQKPPAPTVRGKVWVRPVDGVRMVAVPAGQFIMGSTESDIEKPQHKVTLDGYWIDETPVTVAQYRKYCHATGTKMPRPPAWGWKEDHPMVNVSWDDAKAYATWAGAELPTEAQWEKAARGTDGRKFPWGDKFDRGRLQCSSATYGDAGGPATVMSHPTGKSPYGALDMAGNLWQWCADWYGPSYYEGSPDQNPTGPPSGQNRMLRGGSWFNVNVNFFRCAFRFGGSPADTGSIVGFRCVVRAGSH